MWEKFGQFIQPTALGWCIFEMIKRVWFKMGELVFGFSFPFLLLLLIFDKKCKQQF